MKALKITVEFGTENLLVGFPYKDGQYEEAVETTNNDGTFNVYVVLGDHEETTAAQEQHLNTNSNVIEYSVVELDV